jgi:hypothetical protein
MRSELTIAMLADVILAHAPRAKRRTRVVDDRLSPAQRTLIRGNIERLVERKADTRRDRLKEKS